MITLHHDNNLPFEDQHETDFIISDESDHAAQSDNDNYDAYNFYPDAGF